MKTILRVIIAAAALLVLGALSRIPYDADGADAAMLRLSWRTRGEAVEACRDRTTEELEALPVHMRTPQVCTTRVASYRLQIRVDDGPTITRDLKASGARADRPVYVLWQQQLTPGIHRIRIEFHSTHDPEARRLRMDEQVRVRNGEILLVTQDGRDNDFQIRRGSRRDNEREREHDLDDQRVRPESPARRGDRRQ